MVSNAVPRSHVRTIEPLTYKSLFCQKVKYEARPRKETYASSAGLSR